MTIVYHQSNTIIAKLDIQIIRLLLRIKWVINKKEKITDFWFKQFQINLLLLTSSSNLNGKPIYLIDKIRTIKTNKQSLFFIWILLFLLLLVFLWVFLLDHLVDKSVYGQPVWMLATASLHRHLVIRNCLAVLEVHRVVGRHEFNRSRVGLLLDLRCIIIVHLCHLMVVFIIVLFILVVITEANLINLRLKMPWLLLDLHVWNWLSVLIWVLRHLAVLCIMFALLFLILKNASTLSVEGELRTTDLIVLELSHRFNLELLARFIQLRHVVFPWRLLWWSVMFILWTYNTLVREFVAI